MSSRVPINHTILLLPARQDLMEPAADEFITELEASMVVTEPVRRVVTDLLKKGGGAVMALTSDTPSQRHMVERISTASAFNPESGKLVLVVHKREAERAASTTKENFSQAWEQAQRFSRTLLPHISYTPARRIRR